MRIERGDRNRQEMPIHGNLWRRNALLNPTAHWHLTQNPFDGDGPERIWFPGGDHDEALSRMLYLVEQGHGCGLVWGHAGTGKSRLLREIHRQVRTPLTAVMTLDLSGLSRSEVVVKLANLCGAGLDSRASTPTAWTALEDWLLGRAAVKQRVMWLLDSLDAAAESLETELLRLARLSEHSRTRSALIVALRRPGLTDYLNSHADFVVELRPWDENDSRAFIEQMLQSSGGSTEIIAETAWTELLAAGQGNPQRLMRIMDVALVAGSVMETPQLSADLIAAVVHQLGWHTPTPARMAAVD